ncbi:hypothetical protein LTR91_001547 [Friedmanniomyces endolithicus]|uniref:Glutamyl-tRNA amidotransferase complex subunit Gta3 domain-containing protein n=1 Tax=Friedmanniomyces endolithicus TaxID=329885 RepID=A0A4U0UPG2_9PEZI|nr:hypothetical protein LTS09_008021 [Friedmanniomyces endolithicus]KAK0268019.1 hypothetical protein LTR35_015820 [Friedmanniomyces endolithicus]KAK0275752.1 hypothetical protein LTS00_014899 [Friedmanniomyces endolithicus]KAK0316624.1 hypothetical protein LTR01_000373 [Friedmanniomyces endolithicus]KAK0327832.1 hypothetical protein LTR82_001349 [Friedmanniomyces endolithicus]
MLPRSVPKCASGFTRSLPARVHARPFTTSPPRRDAIERDANGHIDIEKLLSNPSWSVTSLLPSKDHQPPTSGVSSKQLHHLLRLSALPPPKNAAEEAQMLSTLAAQLHFVKEIQKVDTAGMEPLRSLRDETAQGEREAELGMEALKGVLEQEEIRGTHHRRIRRKPGGRDGEECEKWDPLGTAGRRMGRYFVVEGEKAG